MHGRPDQRRFEALLREHQRIVFKVANVYARGAHDRDDLAQEIAAQLWRSFGGFDGRRAKFTTWMYRVALNVAVSRARTARRSGAEIVEPLRDVHLDTVAGTGDVQEASMEKDERIAALHAFIAQLDALNRALVLLYLEDRSYAEIADVLGISKTNVATKLSRIKQRLREQLAVPKPVLAGA
ncbi:MAG TPA: sigma-70 family RNA polymerase sigma factor [Rhodanobacteraceae bacterium]|nr:sigma-70 family RNA polymerase sigma factor [Rhodanobacteraceae bacterium]